MAAVAAALPSVAAIADDAQLLAQAGSLSQGLLAEGGGSSLRSFTFRLDLQHFAAGARLPLNLAKVVLELELPEELAGGCWPCKVVIAHEAGPGLLLGKVATHIRRHGRPDLRHGCTPQKPPLNGASHASGQPYGWPCTTPLHLFE